MGRAEYRPDCGYGWIVVASCFTLNFIMAGLLRAAGVLYVALIDVYGVSREVAATPFSLRFCMRNMSGPLVGALGQRYGIRPVVILGGIVCGIGGIISAFAPDIRWITFAWGGVHGLGYGLCNIIHVLMINRYFQKYRGVALGINYTGDCFGTFLLPLLLEFLLELYGLSGTFLILAGLSLNVVPAAMLLMDPPWDKQDMSSIEDLDVNDVNNKRHIQGIINECFDNTLEECKIKGQKDYPNNFLPAITINEQKNNEKQHGNNQTSIRENNRERNESEQRCMHFPDAHSNNLCKNHRDSLMLNDSIMLNDIYCLRESSSLRVPAKNMKLKRLSCQINAYDTNRENSKIPVPSAFSCPRCIEKSVAEKTCKSQLLHPSVADLRATTENRYLSSKHYYNCDQRRRNSSVINEIHFLNNTSHFNDGHSQRKPSIKAIPLYEEEVLKSLDHACEGIDPQTEGLQVCTNEVQTSNIFCQFLKTNIKPMFLIISATMALYVFLFISVFTIIIDYAADNDIPNEYGKYFIIAFSVTDIIGRVGFGVVLDRKWLPLHYFAGLTTGIMGFCIFIIPLFKCYSFWLVSFTVCGLIQGGTCVMFPVLVGHYMEKNEESVAIGCLNFYGGLLMLPIPAMIGFFRDSIGSYDGVFWTVGALCIFAGSLWIFEPCIIRRKEKKISKKNYRSEDGNFY